MKRILFSLIACSLLVSGCSKKSDLPPDQVLRKSAESVSSLNSAAFTVDASLMAPGNIQLSGNAEGTLQAGGKQFGFTLQLNGNVPSNKGLHALTANLDVAVAGENEVYVRIQSLAFTPHHPAFSEDRIQELSGVWWKLPGSSSATPTSTVSADPRLLQAQASVVQVTEDLGIESVDGRDTYHYKVALDREKLLAFLQATASAKGEAFNRASADMWANVLTGNGDLWIDHETSFVRRISWKFVGADAQMPISLSLVVNLTKQNIADPVAIPTEANPWPLSTSEQGMLPLPKTSSSSSKAKNK
jgi:hypothetical protein